MGLVEAADSEMQKPHPAFDNVKIQHMSYTVLMVHSTGYI